MGGFFDDDKSAEDFFDFDFDDDHDNMEIIGPIVGIIILFLLCTCCGLACKRKREGAIFSTPVVVVSEQHTNAGPYPVTVQHHNANMTATHGAYPMPQPQPHPGGMPGAYPPYPGAMPSTTPYPTNTPYPMAGGGMPMPQAAAAAAMMNPPSYNEVVGNEAYQKQAPYNPNFSS